MPKRAVVVGALLLALLLVAVLVQRTALVAPAAPRLQSESAAPAPPASSEPGETPRVGSPSQRLLQNSFWLARIIHEGPSRGRSRRV
ncbi:MAG TPA: hypothetical protein PKD61_15525, partial [Polyangiaceae bacterium]|nr:hypothetical protein [Polyangiaceae bacterium]